MNVKKLKSFMKREGFKYYYGVAENGTDRFIFVRNRDIAILDYTPYADKEILEQIMYGER